MASDKKVKIKTFNKSWSHNYRKVDGTKFKVSKSKNKPKRKLSI